MTKIFVPTTSPQDWKSLLADPEKQWHTGYSAYAIAHAWEAAKGNFPPEVEHVFADAEDERLRNLKILLAFPEWKVYLPPRGHPSQNDLFILAKGEQGLVSIMVEGKVAEPFGETKERWLTPATPGKLKRLEFIQSKLGLGGELPQTIRYQLLHRTISAVSEAERFGAKSAVMLVHSFSQDHLWFKDYQAFLELFGVHSARPGELYLLTELQGIALFAGWATGDPKFLG